jgi:hypothetical protein
MEVRNLLKRKRGISLPFTDHCSVVGGESVCSKLVQRGIDYGRRRGWRSFECRDIPVGVDGITPSLCFYGHSIDLRRSEQELWSTFKSRVRTPIRRAQEAGITVHFETSQEAVQTFYTLHSLTRKKHGLPPQPRSFFRNIHQCALEEGLGHVAVAVRSGRAVAAGVFLHFGKRAIHKFGASDPELQRLGANHVLLWETIRKYRAEGYDCLDLGRTSMSNDGLRQFKQGFAAKEKKIRYCKYDYAARAFVEERDRAQGWHNAVFRLFPEPLLRLTGKLLYRQMS